MSDIPLSTVIEKMRLKNLIPEIDMEGACISNADVTRPALYLTGYFEYFDPTRVEVIGMAEYSYCSTLSNERKEEIYSRFLSNGLPCVIFCKDLEPDWIFMKHARLNNIPVLQTSRSTSDFMAEIIRWLSVVLAPSITIHGVLVDLYGEGVLITGESGIGKSEAALELIKRGHRLISDDVVVIKKVSDETLVGSAPEITKHLIELRGIGIVDVKALYGASSVKDTQSIDLVIRLEEWDKDKDYDRLGMDEEYTEYLGNKVVCNSIPVRPGRNLAVICETAAINYRQKRMGYNAAKELYKRFQENVKKRED